MKIWNQIKISFRILGCVLLAHSLVAHAGKNDCVQDHLLSLNETIAPHLVQMGFTARKAQEIASRYPNLAKKLIALDTKPQLGDGELIQFEDGAKLDLRSPKVVSTYRGIRVAKKEDFDPDYKGTVGYMSLDPGFPIAGYAAPNSDKPVGLLFEYQVPSLFFKLGPKGYLVLDLEKLKSIEVDSVVPFISRVGTVPEGASRVDQVTWKDYPLANSKNGL